MNIISKLLSTPKKTPARKTENDSYQAWADKHHALDLLRNKYAAVSDKHFSLLVKADELYSKLNKEDAWSGGNADKLAAICLEDISIANQVRDYWLEENKIQKTGGGLPRYPAFQTLAKLYEKQCKFSDAINVCKLAISLGFADDGTKGGMCGRIERLEKKINSSH